MPHKKFIIPIVVLFTFAYWWVMASPPDDFTIGPAYTIGKTPQAILDVQTKHDAIAVGLKNDPYEFSGYDDIAFQKSTGTTFISGMGGAIWKLDRGSQQAERITDVPLMPTGIQLDPLDNNLLYFCSSKMGGVLYPETERVGLYSLNILSKQVKPVVLDLPKFASNPPETSFVPGNRPSMKLERINQSNSRPFSLCNDLAISQDGQRIYMSEPNPLARASMGSGAVLEAIGLAPIGKLWLYDRLEQTISLVVDNYTFVDGLVLEERGGVEQAVIFTETTKFRIMKTSLVGSNAGKTEILWDYLPGMPDGLDRDSNGNIWIGFLKKRSKLISWIHNNPWVKPFFARLPLGLLPVSKDTGIMALSPDGKIPLYYLMHDGSELSDVSVVSPNNGKLYFPVFSEHSSGLYYIDNPLNVVQ